MERDSLGSRPVTHPPVFSAIKINLQIEAIPIMKLADSQPFAGGVLTLNCG
jgi:hypothetical protein